MSSFDTYVFLTDQPIGRKEDKAGKLAYELRQKGRGMFNYRLHKATAILRYALMALINAILLLVYCGVPFKIPLENGSIVIELDAREVIASTPAWLMLIVWAILVVGVYFYVKNTVRGVKNFFMSFWLGGVVWRYRHEGVYNIWMSDAGNLWLKMPGAAPSFKLELGDRDDELKKFIMSEIHYNMDLRQALAGFVATLGRDSEACLRNLHIAYKRFLEDRRIKHPQLWDFDESSSSL